MDQINYAEYIANTLTIILAIAGLITTIGGALIMVKKLFNGSKTNKNTIAIGENKKAIDMLNARVKNLEETSDKQNDFRTVMCNSMLALLNHNINGNSIDNLEKAKEELKDYLIKDK